MVTLTLDPLKVISRLTLKYWKGWPFYDFGLRKRIISSVMIFWWMKWTEGQNQGEDLTKDLFEGQIEKMHIMEQYFRQFKICTRQTLVKTEDFNLEMSLNNRPKVKDHSKLPHFYCLKTT